MKAIVLLLFSLIGVSGFSQGYYLADVVKAKTIIADFITKSIKEEKNKGQPSDRSQ